LFCSGGRVNRWELFLLHWALTALCNSVIGHTTLI
jgi:hypothetical protein